MQTRSKLKAYVQSFLYSRERSKHVATFYFTRNININNKIKL